MTVALTLVDQSSVARMFLRRNDVVEFWRFPRFREDFLAKRRMTAVPFEDARHFTPESAKAIVRACQTEGFQRADVIPLIDEPRCCYQATLCTEALQALSDIDKIWTSFLLLEENDRFAVICDELFNTIAGSREFVANALERGIASASADFLKDFVDEAWFPAGEKEQLRELVDYYGRIRD